MKNKIKGRFFIKVVHLLTGLKDKWACINILKLEVIIDKSKNMGSKITPLRFQEMYVGWISTGRNWVLRKYYFLWILWKGKQKKLWSVLLQPKK